MYIYVLAVYDLSAVCSKITSIVGFDAQVDILIKETELNQDEIGARQRMCIVLQEAFRPIYPNCIVTPFGSSANTLGFHGCDLDALVDLGMSSRQGGL